MREIYYCPAPTGAGKTYALVGRIADLTDDGQTVILIQPTKALCNETKSEIVKRYPKIIVELINQDTCFNKVGNETNVSTYLREYLKRPFDGPHAIIITWASFIAIPSFDRPDRFHVICDEIPNAFVSKSIHVPDNHSWFTDALMTVPRGPVYDLLSVKDCTVIRKVAENNKQDQVSAIFSDLAFRLLHNKHFTYVRREAYHGLLRGSRDNSDLTTFCLLNPAVFDGFRSVLMVGARAEETILHKWFSQIGVPFVLDETLMTGLRFQEHQNGNWITFYYASETNWSFTQQAKDESFRPMFEKAVVELMGDRVFCWQDNVRNEGISPFIDLPNACNLPNSAHGLNRYQGINNAVIMTALNYESEQYGFLANFCGIDREAQKVLFAYHASYQSYNRTSVRDPNNHEKKIIVLPDRQNADWQQARFPGSTVRSLGIDSRVKSDLGRPRIYEDATARKQAYRDREAQKQMEVLDRVIQATNEKESFLMIGDCDVSSLKDIGDYVANLNGSLIAQKYDSASTCLVGTKAEFINNLRQLSRRKVSSKTESMLISPGHFLPVEGRSSQRSLENAVFGKNVYLDIENGTLKYRDILKIFPDLEMAFYSSYNHTSELPRYRVIIFTDTIMEPSVYRSIYHQTVKVIEDAGYAKGVFDPANPKRKVHGIDLKPNVTDMFYLPSQPRVGKGFFYHHHGDRQPLRVRDWITHAIPTRFDDMHMVERSNEAIQTTLVGDAAMIVDRALQTFWNDTVIQGKSHTALRRLNFTLIEAGVDDINRDVALTIAASSSNSPQDRIQDKNRMMRSKGG